MTLTTAVCPPTVAPAPGTTFNYNTAGTHLMSVMLTSAVGGSLRTFAREELFNKLGVNEGLVTVTLPPEALDQYVRGEEERWRRVIRDAGITVE